MLLAVRLIEKRKKNNKNTKSRNLEGPSFQFDFSLDYSTMPINQITVN